MEMSGEDSCVEESDES